MSYICTKVTEVSTELAQNFWDAGAAYYGTEGTLLKFEGSNALNQKMFLKDLANASESEYDNIYQVAKNGYVVALIPTNPDGNKIKGGMILVRPKENGSKAYLHDENGMLHAFVDFWKAEGYTALHGPAIFGKSMYLYLKASCENGIMPCSFADEVYHKEFYENNFPDNPPMQWITFTFNE
tara:strand:+ start:90 stop:632 length:543 start_codon:yes stop_codon:yes gene_type:complete